MALLLARNDPVLGAETELQLRHPTNRWWRNLLTYCNAKLSATVDDLVVHRLKPQHEVVGDDLLAGILASVTDDDVDGEEQVDTVSELTVFFYFTLFTHARAHTRLLCHRWTSCLWTATGPGLAWVLSPRTSSSPVRLLVSTAACFGVSVSGGAHPRSIAIAVPSALP